MTIVSKLDLQGIVSEFVIHSVFHYCGFVADKIKFDLY